MTATHARWQNAQAAELRYWSGMTLAELLRICAEKPAFLEQLSTEQAALLFDGKDVLEIGCGPLGLSVASFYSRKHSIRRLVKSDPLPQVSLAETPVSAVEWARPFTAWVEGLMHEGDYVQGAGEEFEVTQRFDTVITYNVIDHVRDPLAVLKSGFDALRSGGTILVGVDCLSFLGRLKFEHYTRRARKGSILVEAHPHSFLAHHILRLLTMAGFASIECLIHRSLARRMFGSSYRPAFFARRP